MLPHKTARGAAALARLQAFEGVPPPYDKKKRVVIPSALRVLKLKPQRPFTVLGRLSHEVGWGYQDVIEKLEAKRKTKAAAWYARQKQLKIFKSQAILEAAKSK